MNIQNIAQILASANGRSHQRIVTETAARHLIESAEGAVKTLPMDLRAKAIYQYAEGVCNSYRYPAQTTWIAVRFNADGEAISLTATRTYAPKGAYGKTVSRLALSGVAEKIAGFPGGYKQL